MWTSTKAMLGLTSHDIQTILLCMLGGLIGALVHITIVYLMAQHDNTRLDGLKGRMLAYGFIGLIIGLCIGFLFAGVLLDTPSATRTILAISLLCGWQAHRWFKRGVFDAAH